MREIEEWKPEISEMKFRAGRGGQRSCRVVCADLHIS